MEISTSDIKALFNGDLHYVVPRFQRHYVWCQDVQWEPLWLDISDKAQEILDRGSSKPHFLGAVVLKQIPSDTDQPTTFLVVDGQQRLTTLQMLLLAVASAAREAHDELAVTVAAATRMTINAGYQDDPTYRYKVRPFVDDDFKVFKGLVDDNKSSKSTSHVMADGLAFFKHKASKWLDRTIEVDDLRRRADALIKAALQYITVAKLRLDPSEDEYVIFETLNARGAPLTEWEKAKNHLLSKARREGESYERCFYDSYIDRFDSQRWWVEAITGPRFRGRRVDQLLNYWLEIRLSRHVKPDRTYHEFCRFVRGASDMEGIAKSFSTYASAYEVILTWPRETARPPDSTKSTKEWLRYRFGLFLYRLDAIGARVVMPLLIRLYVHLGAGRTWEEWETEPRLHFDRCMRALECYLVRRKIMNWNARGYSGLFLSLLKKINAANQPAHNAMMILHGLTSTVYKWPNDDEVRDAVRTQRVYPGTRAGVRQNRIRMLLEGVEEQLLSQSGMAGRASVPRGLWIEHVMPLKWHQNWPLPPGTTEEEREQAIAALGNLTLTNDRLDIKLANKSLGVKRQMFEEHCNLFLNRQLLKLCEKGWDEAAIQKRGAILGDIICKSWPSAEELDTEFQLAKESNSG